MSICPPQSSDQVLYAGIITLYPKIIQRARLGFPVSSGCRMTESYQHPVCNLVIQYSARSSEGSHKLIGNFFFLDKDKAWWMFHVKDYSFLLISCGIWRIERWIIQDLTMHRIILLTPNGRILQNGLATDRIWGSTSAVLFVELSRKRFQEAQSAKLNYFLCFIYLLLALSFASFFGYLFTSIN